MSDDNQDRRHVVDKSADLMRRVQAGEITGEQAMQEMLADPKSEPFTISG